jgi:AraC-like DNA-binding protein
MRSTIRSALAGCVAVVQHHGHNLQVTLSRPVGLRAGFHADIQDPVSGLVHAGEQWAPEQFLIEPHTHAVWELYVQMQGVTRWVAGDQIYTLGPGHLLAVPPGLQHHLSGRSGVHHFYYAAVDLEPVARRHPELSVNWRSAVRHHRAGDLSDAFVPLIRELTMRQEHSDVGLALAVDHLVLAVIRSMMATASPRLALHPAVVRVRQLLDQRFDERWTLGRMADYVGLAPTYLAGLFVSQVGQPPHRYLNERRVERARQLLESSDLSVTAMALSLGFSSSQHFARVFRELTATTPTAFRARPTGTGAASRETGGITPCAKGSCPRGT